MTPPPARCLYALRPHDRPGCELTATLAYGPIVLCSACDQQRSTLGKGHVARQLPATVDLDPLALLTDAHQQLIAAGQQLDAAVTRARQHHTTWIAIATALGTTRQAAQQRFRQT